MGRAAAVVAEDKQGRLNLSGLDPPPEDGILDHGVS